MSRNTWIGIIVAIFLIAGVWLYLKQSGAPVISETTQFPTTQQNAIREAQPVAPTQPTPSTQQAQTTTITQLVPIASVKVGDKIGAFTITSIEPSTLRYANSQKDFTVGFSGQTTIKGTFEIGGFWGTDSVTLAIEKADNPQLPRFMFVENENTKLIVCISNPDVARQVLSGKQGNISVMVKNYVVRFETDTAFCDVAEFVGLAQ